MILADLGANVIKVERPGLGDDTRQWGPPWVEGEGVRESGYFLSVNRGKRSVAIDLSDPEGRALVCRLARDADVLVENFLPGTLDRWGLGYEALGRDNPRLIYCTIVGYGSSGPGAARAGYDFAVQADAGWMAITGEVGGEPMKVGVAVVDVLTGQNAAIAVLAALRGRERSGQGQRIEVTLFDSALAGLVNVAQGALLGGEARRYGNAHPNIVPYQAFDAADRSIIIAVGNDAQWQKLCVILELELSTDERFASNPARVENRDILLPLIAARVRTRAASDWIDELEAAGIPCSLIRSVGEAVHDPTFRARGGTWEFSAGTETFETIASPLRLQRTPPGPGLPPPALGEHTEQVEKHGWGE